MRAHRKKLRSVVLVRCTVVPMRRKRRRWRAAAVSTHMTLPSSTTPTKLHCSIYPSRLSFLGFDGVEARSTLQGLCDGPLLFGREGREGHHEYEESRA